jgi:hypothetical protein
MDALVISWLEGLAEMGSTFLELIPCEKRTRQKWFTYQDEIGARGVSSAVRWLMRGSGVGILIKSPLWVLDCDTPEEVERQTSIALEAGVVPLTVETPAHGAHLYMRLPKLFSLEFLKNHLCHPHDEDGIRREMDFKFGPRSLIAVPGTQRAGRLYQPRSLWTLPPICDPHLFLPRGKFWRQSVPFLRDTRPRRDRIAHACTYLKLRAPVSVSKRGGHRTLMGVVAHLVQYLDLDPELAFHMLTHGPNPWNQRCIDRDGTPYPWSNVELWEACTHAVDIIPAAGRKAYLRMEARQRDRVRLSEAVCILREYLTMPQRHRIPVKQIRDFLEWAIGQSDLTEISLGDELVRQDIRRIRSTRKRIFCVPRLDFASFCKTVLESERIRQVLEGRTAGCALIKHVGSLRVEHQVSTIP